MVSIIDMQNTFLIQWVKKITMNFDYNFVYLPMYYYGELGMDLSVFGSNISAKHFQGLHHIKSLFLRNVLCSWLDSKGVITYDDIPTTGIMISLDLKEMLSCGNHGYQEVLFILGTCL